MSAERVPSAPCMQVVEVPVPANLQEEMEARRAELMH